MLLFDISIIGPLHALVSLCSGVMWVFILFLAAALKNAHCDFLLTEALSSTQVFLWILKTLFLSQFFLFANSVFINVEASLQCALGGNFGGSAYGLFKAGQIYSPGLPESMGSSLNDCVKNLPLFVPCIVLKCAFQ